MPDLLKQAFAQNPALRQRWEAMTPAQREAVMAELYPEKRPGDPAEMAMGKPTFLEALGGAAKERLGEIGSMPGDVAQKMWSDVKGIGAAMADPNTALRMAPLAVPGAGPMATTAMNLGTEGLAQYREGDFQPGRLALATLPAVLAGGARAVRAGDRMATRLSQPRFQAAQQEALDAAGDLTRTLTPDTRAMYAQARQAAATAPPVATPETSRVLADLARQQTAAPALSPASEAGRAITRQAAPLGAGTPVPLETVDAYLQELNKAVATRAPGKDVAKLLAGSAVKDVEAAAGAGNQGADLLRQAATAYKAQLGAQRLNDMVTKAAPSLTGVGPALNVANLEKFVRADKDLPRLLGPQGMAQVEAFIDRFRGLPPDHAAQFWPMLLSTLGGGGAGSGIGYAAGGPVGAAIGAAAGATVPEYLRNLFYVGANPKPLNQGLTAAGQAARYGLGAALGRRE